MAEIEFVELRTVLKGLLDALPRCDACREPATRSCGRGGVRRCDAHGDGVPAYPRAPWIRHARRVLAATQPPPR